MIRGVLPFSVAFAVYWRIRKSDEFVNIQPIQIFMVRFVQNVEPLKIPKKLFKTTCNILKKVV